MMNSLIIRDGVEDPIAVLDHRGAGPCDGREPTEAGRQLEVGFATAGNKSKVFRSIAHFISRQGPDLLRTVNVSGSTYRSLRF